MMYQHKMLYINLYNIRLFLINKMKKMIGIKHVMIQIEHIDK